MTVPPLLASRWTRASGGCYTSGGRLSAPGGEVNGKMREDRTGRSPNGPRAVILIRLLVGLVFFEEGVQKFLIPALMGAGRFARIGMPAPEAMGPCVGG